MGLRGRLAVLSEGYSNADFQTRILATYNFVRELLSLAAEQGATIKSLVKASDRARPDSIVVRSVLAPGIQQDVIAEINPMTGGQATAFAFLPDGRILITTKNGIVRIVKNGELLATPFIDLRDRVNDYWDHGLLGVEVDPVLAFRFVEIVLEPGGDVAFGGLGVAPVDPVDEVLLVDGVHDRLAHGLVEAEGLEIHARVGSAQDALGAQALEPAPAGVLRKPNPFRQFALRGGIGLEHGRAGFRVERFNGLERFAHGRLPGCWCARDSTGVHRPRGVLGVRRRHGRRRGDVGLRHRLAG
jgi:hypothetical protein